MDKKLSMYLQYDLDEVYQNTPEEAEMMARVYTLYTMAQAACLSSEEQGETRLEQQRRAYMGTLDALDRRTGKESEKHGKQIRKLIYEMIESKIDTSIPVPRIRSNSKALLPIIEKTEEMLKYEIDRLLTEDVNDMAERLTYVDGTCWYKVWWNPLDISQDKNGDVALSVLPVDRVYPQPGVTDFRKLEYLFERGTMSTSGIYDIYGKVIRSTRTLQNVNAPQGSTVARDGENVVDLVNIITFYFLNSERRVGRVIFKEEDRTVISYEEDWLVKKVEVAEEGKPVKYKTQNVEILKEDIYEIKNQYTADELDGQGRPKPEAMDQKIAQGLQEGLSDQEAVDAAQPFKGELFLKAGTEVPCYHIKVIPFVPRVNVSKMNSIYGVSDADMLKNIQDELNKCLSRTSEKIQKSGGVLFKDSKVKIDNDNSVLKIVNLKDPSMAAGSKYVDINPQVQGDILFSQTAYESGRATIGITNSWQGKQDATATSGKAKEISSMATAGRLEAPRVMKRAALAEVYRIMFMFKLAFSSGKTSFVKLLPEANMMEREWDKYAFLYRKDDGTLAYHDEFAFSVDAAATLSNDRQAMWQETLQMFTMGTMGPATDPRNLLTFWGIMEQLQYPLAKFAIANIKNNQEHLDPAVEQLLVTNPSVLSLAMEIADEQGLINNQGGARANSGPAGNGMTHAANVNKTNANNAAQTSNNNSVQTGAKAGGGA